ncbi:MAG: pyruvate kinase [Gammaproteobacteria bacterium]|nr:pyruvate kinase [Gammaproteobacteria bacterium]
MAATRRKTKIICTVGPATASYEGIERLYQAGMSVVRLNMSHASQDEAAEIIHWIKTLNRKVRYPMPIMLDTQGPEIRTGPLDEPLVLHAGQKVFLDVAPQPTADVPSIAVNYPGLAEAVAVGDRVRLDNGLINVRVTARTDGRLECQVADGGLLGSRKHVNLPGVAVNLASITDKDRDDISFGIAEEIDFIALSFVRSAADIAELRELLGPRAGRVIQVIAKIENTEGVRNAEEIARAADAVMVARGDLGIETDIATLPIVQRRLAEICARLGKRCIIATHLMESMIENPIPTRAEVTDVANAVYEGADAIMLSGETSIGAYPYRCVEQLANIAEASERQRGFSLHESLANDTAKQHLATSAARLAEAIHAAGIVVITRRGITADLMTNCHPDRVPIFAFTNTSQTRRRLMLNRGVFAYRTSFSNDPEKTIQTAFAVLREREGIGPDESVVVISDVLAEKAVDAIQLRKVGAG